MTHRWLHLRLASPLMAFGGVAIDQVGPTRDFPSASSLAGLLANALGFDRTEWQAHQDLQDRLIFGAVITRQGELLTDQQNARVYEGEAGWTTSGVPDARNKGASYSNPPEPGQYGSQCGRKWLTHRRRRDYLADHDLHIVLRLDGSPSPTLDDLAEALKRPARPLFIGRKPCLPTAPILAGEVTAPEPRAALIELGVSGQAIWPGDTDVVQGTQNQDLVDLRNWRNGLHSGTRPIQIGILP